MSLRLVCIIMWCLLSILSAESNECRAVSQYSQITSTVLMIPPNNHSAVFDTETAADNKFMNQIEIDLEILINEWNSVVQSLEQNGIQVITATHDESNLLQTPNCLFPNNWLSTHPPNILAIYPMKAPNRRLEIRNDIINSLNYQYVHDMTPHVDDDLFLEGTGALVLDRQFKIAYMSISERASSQLAVQWAKKFNYQLILFESVDDNNDAIYHTNVMMSVGSSYVIICVECIKGAGMRQIVKDVIINESNKEIIEITQLQIKNFCGNVLEVGTQQNRILMMSDTAFNSFDQIQKDKLQKTHGLKLVYPKVSQIETIFGGGVRCMIAELFPSMICEDDGNDIKED